MPATATHGITLEVAPGHTEGFEITFSAEARPGLLALFSGVLTLTGLDITWASIRLHSDGTVRDVIQCTPIDPEMRAGDAEAALMGAIEQFGTDPGALDRALRSRRAAAPAASASATVVAFEHDSAITLGIRVRTPDRMGVLHDIAAVLARHGMRTRSISVMTIDGEARDVFRVVGPDGEVPTDARRLAALHRELLDALA